MPDQTDFNQGLIARTIRIGLGLIVGGTFVLFAVRNVHFAEVRAILSHATVTPLVFAVVAFVADFLLRAVRFWIMLQSTTGRRLPLRTTIGPFIASFGMSDVLPLRVGDGFRVVWFSRQFGIAAGTVIGTMIVERILDLVTIVLLGGISLAVVSLAAPPALVWNFQLLLAVTFVGGLAMLFAPTVCHRGLATLFRQASFGPINKLIEAMRAASRAVAKIRSWRYLGMLTAISVALWLLESGVFLGVWLSLGGSINALLQPFLAFAFSTLGTLVPSLPGHFGPFEFFGLQAFTLAGVDTPMAAAVVLLAHLILWAPTALFGIGWLLSAAIHAPDTSPKVRNPVSS
jgi:uncharacterized protein (TIRG00374 family)